MNVEPYDDKDGYRVWLSRNELQQLTNATTDSQQAIAVQLGGQCGLRSGEVTRVAPEHVVETDAGPMIRVFDSKGREYRETPCPESLATQIWTIDDVRSESASEPVIDVSTRTLRRWIESARETLVEDDDMWEYVGFHDLRRTWANQLRSCEVDAMLVCDWGGWDDLETFLEHYKGIQTPEAQRRERNKTDWLSVGGK
jgi:integrase